jgi:translocation and assembly module TamB
VTRRRRQLIIAIAIPAALALAVVSIALILQSHWLYNHVRTWLVTKVETATGGRVEIGAFRLDWKLLRAEVDDFTLHGTEPPGKPPLFHAAYVAVGLKIVSLFRRDVDIQYLDVAAPQVNLIVGPDGRTNFPQPKTHSSGKQDASETILKLAINRFTLWNGEFEINSQQKAPFELRGQNLNANLLYELPPRRAPNSAPPDPRNSSDASSDARTTFPRYHGNISIQPLELQFKGVNRTPVAIDASLSFEKNRIGIAAAHLAANGLDIQLSGALQDFTAPHVAVDYVIHATMQSIVRIFRTQLMDRGDMIVAGNAQWAGSDLSATGNLHAYNLNYKTGDVRLQNLRADGALAVNSKGASLTAMRYSGAVNEQAVEGRVETAVLTPTRDRRPFDLARNHLDLSGVAVASVGGVFHGDAHAIDFDQYTVTGNYSGLDIKRVAAIYTPYPLPWDGLVSGTANLEGSFKRAEDLTIATNATIVPTAGSQQLCGAGAIACPPAAAPPLPGAGSPPVNGHITASYNARADLLDLGHSTISLPNSRAEFSGVLGRTLTVHLETTDLGDILPALGSSAASIPVKLQNGSAVFDGTVNGPIDAPQATGHLNATNVLYNADLVDSVSAEVDVSPNSLCVQNGAVTHAAMQAQFQATVAMRDWKIESAAFVSGSAAIHNSKAANLVALLKPGVARVEGTVNATFQVSGTIGDPHAIADIAVAQGSFNGEPFDRVAAHLGYTVRTIDLTGGQVNAGGKQVTVTASFDHAPDHFDAGRLKFQLASNAMPLQQIHTLQAQRPGAAGTLQIEADGAVDLAPPSGAHPGDREGYRIEDFHATVAALDLRLNGQQFGNAHLTANSQNGGLHAHLDSNFANSVIQGEGQWQLTGDYPGSAVVNFSRLDFNQLHDWITPNAPSAASFTGSAEGELHVDGSALKPETLKAELRIPKFQISPLEQIGTAAPITLANSGDIVARLANSVITVESAHFTGRSTDLSLTGRITLREKNPLDLRVNGHIDLAELHDINRDFVASGVVTADASVRGDLASPQINGRMQFEKATFNISDFPNGISNATGVIAFSGDRATIQSLTGETGGGKVELSGFATYSEGHAVFRVHAAARQVRVRKPEGVSTVANAELNFTGSTTHSMLSGTITVLRAAFNPDSDFSSLLAQSAEPVRTPAAQTGLLGGLNFDVQISTSPDIEVQSTLTQDVQIDANLHLRGSASNPALLGRVNITQGRVLFLGTKYTIDGGSIAFYNPVKIAPVLDIDLQTKAQGIDITLTISGPADHLTLIPSSDPPFTYNEIISLLATGRSPSSDPALLSAQSTSPAAYQQSGPSSLLGSAISTPVSGRLQRFFGVSSLRIDPTIPGVDANPQARLTLEQQVSPNVTFTYITNVTTSNPQIIQVEWAIGKKWSAVALREENGMTGLDIFFKKRF